MHSRGSVPEDFLMAAYLIFTHKVTDADTLNNDYLPRAVETLHPA